MSRYVCYTVIHTCVEDIAFATIFIHYHNLTYCFIPLYFIKLVGVKFSVFMVIHCCFESFQFCAYLPKFKLKNAVFA